MSTVDKINYGAVVFDDRDRPSAGWGCVAGNPSFRVRGTGDLPTDVVWWTNVKSDVFWKMPGLNQGKLRSSEYLRPNMDQLMSELGLHISRMPAAQIVEHVAEVFGRVMRLASKYYDVVRPGANNLTEDLYDNLIKEDKGITPDIDSALLQAKQDWSQCETQRPSNSQMVTFRRPRLQHAMDLIKTPVPGEQWEFVKGEALGPEKHRVQMVVGQSRPALVKASIIKVEHEVAPIIAFGATGQRNKGSRGWMTHPELLFLSRFAKIRVDAAFLGNDYETHPVKKAMFGGGIMGSLSTSVGILAENYACTLMMPRPYKKGEKDRPVSPRAAWLSAADRFHSMMPAMMLHGSGFAVMGYGRGMVTMMVQRGALAEAKECASAAGLLSPLYIPEEIAIREALAS